MFDVRHATLCLLITYHWHGCSAVSAWPSGRDGIATEVNGSPTDASLNIPVVKRSSNQADPANELPWRALVVVGDSREHGDEFHVRGPFEVPHREYGNRNVKKYTKSTIHVQGTKKMMIEASLDHPKPAKGYGKRKNVENGRGEERDKFDVADKSLIPRKDMVEVVQLIGGANPSTVTDPRSLLQSRRWSDHDLTSASTSYGRKRRNVQMNSVRVKETASAWKKEGSSVQVNNRKTSRNPVLLGDGIGTFVVGGTRGKNLSMLSRDKRETLPVDKARIDSVANIARKQKVIDGKTEDYDPKSRPSNGSSLLSEGRSTEHVRALDERSEPNDTSSGISSSSDVNKIRETGRLHQQSRNTRPRTIIRHLRGIIKRQIGPYDDDSKFRIGPADVRKRRQLTNQRNSNFVKFNGNPQQLRFIPSYNNYGRNPKYSSSHGSRENQFNNEFLSLTPNGRITSGNFRKVPKFEARQIDQLRKSLSGVFDRPQSINEKEELPNVRTILPKQIFVASPRLIYDTKILPAPFSFPSYYQNSDNNINDDGNNDVDNRQKINPSALPIRGVFDQTEMGADLQRPGIPVSENSQEPVASLRNFVTPLPPYKGEVSLPVNEEASMPLDPTFADEIYQVREVGQEDEVRNPSEGTRINEYETFQRDEDEASRLNDESPGATVANNHSGDVRSSYGNPVSTYANHAESGPGNVDHSTVIGTINDEYMNHQTTRYGEVANIETDLRMSHVPSRGQDDRGDRGSYKWRGKYDDDHARYAAKYSFGYRVSDGETQNDFGHQETRDEGITRGRYHVRLPDGRTQRVNYHVDDKGYHAVVSYHSDNV